VVSVNHARSPFALVQKTALWKCCLENKPECSLTSPPSSSLRRPTALRKAPYSCSAKSHTRPTMPLRVDAAFHHPLRLSSHACSKRHCSLPVPLTRRRSASKLAPTPGASNVMSKLLIPAVVFSVPVVSLQSLRSHPSVALIPLCITSLASLKCTPPRRLSLFR